MTFPFLTAAFFAVIVATFFLTTAAMKCPIGTSRTKKGSCQKCSPGTYQDKPNQTKCQKCPAGTFSQFSGVISFRLCLDCPEDSTSLPGSTSCIKCPKGGKRSCGKCVVCRPGSSISDCDKKCKKCSSDHFSNTVSAYACTRCPDGQRPTDDRRGCRDSNCPVGTIWNFGRCQKCGLDNIGAYLAFRNASMTQCDVCPPRTTVTNFFDPQENCIKCPPGQFLSDVVVKTFMGIPVCFPCPEGSTTKGFGKVLCRRKGAPCPSNMFEDADGDCEICQKGQKYVPTKKKCVECAVDEYSEGGLVTECRKCGGGRLRSPFNKCLCPAGKVFQNGKCRNCPAGTYRNVEQFDSECLDCFDSEFSFAGASECKSCPDGYSSRRSGGTKCEKVRCRKGFISPSKLPSAFGNDVCISGATGCPAGLSGLGFAGRFLCADESGNVVCPKGFVFDGVDDCINCSEGYQLEKKENGKLSCMRCPRGTVSMGGLVTKCKRCENGKVPNGSGDGCECPPLTILRNGKCESCANGWRVVDDPIDGKICVKCPRGTFWKGKYPYCFNCAVNTTSEEGATKCTKCPKGTRTYEGGGDLENTPVGDANCVPV